MVFEQLILALSTATVAVKLMTLPLKATTVKLVTIVVTDDNNENHILRVVLLIFQGVCNCVFRRGQAHLTMISRQTSELGKSVLNPGQYPLAVFMAGNEGSLAGAHIPAHHHHHLLAPTTCQQTCQAVCQSLYLRVYQLSLCADLHGRSAGLQVCRSAELNLAFRVFMVTTMTTSSISTPWTFCCCSSTMYSQRTLNKANFVQRNTQI